MAVRKKMSWWWCEALCLGGRGGNPEGCLEGLGGAKLRRRRAWGSLSVEVGASREVAVGEGVVGRGESGSRRGVWKSKVLAWESPSVSLSSSTHGARVGERRLGGLGLA